MGKSKEEYIETRQDREFEYIVKKQRESEACQKIIRIVKETPNDMLLGQKVRAVVRSRANE